MIIVSIVVGSAIVNGIMVEGRRNRVRLRMQVIADAACDTHLVEVSYVQCLLAY